MVETSACLRALTFPVWPVLFLSRPLSAPHLFEGLPDHRAASLRRWRLAPALGASLEPQSAESLVHTLNGSGRSSTADPAIVRGSLPDRHIAPRRHWREG